VACSSSATEQIGWPRCARHVNSKNCCSEVLPRATSVFLTRSRCTARSMAITGQAPSFGFVDDAANDDIAVELPVARARRRRTSSDSGWALKHGSIRGYMASTKYLSREGGVRPARGNSPAAGGQSRSIHGISAWSCAHRSMHRRSVGVFRVA
jgi:hypothetical protein